MSANIWHFIKDYLYVEVGENIVNLLLHLLIHHNPSFVILEVEGMIIIYDISLVGIIVLEIVKATNY